MKLYTSGASSVGDSLRTVEKDTSLPLRSGLFTELSKQWAGPGYGIRSDLMTSHEPAPLRRVRSTLVGPLAHPPTHRAKRSPARQSNMALDRRGVTGPHRKTAAVAAAAFI